MANPMLSFHIEIKDTVSKKLQRMATKFPGYVTFLEIRAVEEVKEGLRQVLLDKVSKGEFKTARRLLRGIFSQKLTEGNYIIGIQATGSPNTDNTPTIGAEKLVRVLDRGTFRPHKILPRAFTGGQFRMSFTAGMRTKGPATILRWFDNTSGQYIYRTHVTRHKVRGRHFFKEAVKISRIRVRNLLKNSFRILVEEK